MKKNKKYSFNKKNRSLVKTFFIGGLILFGSYQTNTFSLGNYELQTKNNQPKINNNTLLKQQKEKHEDEEYNILIGMGVFILFCLIMLIVMTVWIKYFRKDDDNDSKTNKTK